MKDSATQPSAFVSRAFSAVIFVSVSGVAGPLSSGTAHASPYQPPGYTERVSVATDGTQGTGLVNIGSELPDLSDDGRFVVFDSLAPNLAPGEANGNQPDVFVRDRLTGTTTRVSVSRQGQGGNNASFAARVSGDGRFIVYESVASNLVADDLNGGYRDVFVYDRTTAETTLISKSLGGASGNDSSYYGVANHDGRYIAFESEASNLVPGDTNDSFDVFLYDRQTADLKRISVDSSGTEANAPSFTGSLSADGRYVTFSSRATNLGGNVMGYHQTYRFDRTTGEIMLVSKAIGGTPGNGSSGTGWISSDGRFVAFDSLANNLVPDDENGSGDVFVRDMLTGITRRVSVDAAGNEGNDLSSFGRISADGRVVTFTSDATNLINNDTDGARDIFVHDLQSGSTEMVSVASDGAQATFPSTDDPSINQYVWHPSVSGDGRFVAWDSSANNMVPQDTNDTPDVFVRDRGPDLGIGQMSVNQSGDQVEMAGWVRFSGVEVAVASDAPSDAAPNGAFPAGELTGGRVVYRPEQTDLLFTLELASLPPSPSGPGTMYGVTFVVDATDYELRAFRTEATANPAGAGFFALYRCQDSCTELARLAGSVGSTGNKVLISLPLAALNAGAAPTLTGLSAYSAAGEATSGPVSVLDEMNLPDVTVPIRSVSLGIAPDGTPESQVLFNTAASLDGGNFEAALDTCALSSGSYNAWAKVCLGKTCRTSSVPVELTGSTCSFFLFAASRKTHGSAGVFDVSLPLNGKGTECRTGGANGEYQLVFTFANPLTSVGGVSVTGGTGSSSGNIDPNDSHNYVVTLTGVVNAQTMTVSLTNVRDSAGASSASVSVSMSVLLGDTNGDGAVNSADIAQTKSQSGQSVSTSNFREDVTVDGNLNSADISLVKSKSGTAFP